MLQIHQIAAMHSDKALRHEARIQPGQGKAARVLLVYRIYRYPVIMRHDITDFVKANQQHALTFFDGQLLEMSLLLLTERGCPSHYCFYGVLAYFRGS